MTITESEIDRLLEAPSWVLRHLDRDKVLLTIVQWLTESHPDRQVRDKATRALGLVWK